MLPLSPDSIDTPQVMLLMRELVGACNVYMAESGPSANARLLHSAALYLTQLLRVFGVIPREESLGFPLTQEGDSDQVWHSISVLREIISVRLQNLSGHSASYVCV